MDIRSKTSKGGKKLKSKRTQKEIVNRIEERKTEDFFGFETDDYIDYLTYGNAKKYLMPEVTKEEWNETEKEVLAPIEQIKDYMGFAWDKANNCRGLSANRSISHMLAWLWLGGEDALLEKVMYEYYYNYHYYGKPILEMICEYFGLDWKQWDDGDRTNG